MFLKVPSSNSIAWEFIRNINCQPGMAHAVIPAMEEAENRRIKV
jgi:hypothetical protein